MGKPTIFISYSHKDREWEGLLRPHLGLLEKAGRITLWDDRRIDAGDTWYNEIEEAMADAAVSVCLISADYLDSKNTPGCAWRPERRRRLLKTPFS